MRQSDDDEDCENKPFLRRTTAKTKLENPKSKVNKCIKFVLIPMTLSGLVFFLLLYILTLSKFIRLPVCYNTKSLECKRALSNIGYNIILNFFVLSSIIIVNYQWRIRQECQTFLPIVILSVKKFRKGVVCSFQFLRIAINEISVFIDKKICLLGLILSSLVLIFVLNISLFTNFTDTNKDIIRHQRAVSPHWPLI